LIKKVKHYIRGGAGGGVWIKKEGRKVMGRMFGRGGGTPRRYTN